MLGLLVCFISVFDVVLSGFVEKETPHSGTGDKQHAMLTVGLYLLGQGSKVQVVEC